MNQHVQCPTCGAQFDKRAAGGMCPKCLLRNARTFEPEVAATQSAGGSNRRPTPPKPGTIDSLFPELEILDLIGQGGMGFVYKARQKNLGREVAVKLLSTSLMDDPTFAERFTREARAMAMMNHPNIISIYDFGQRGTYYYLVMEYVDGLNLRQLTSTTKVEPSEAMQLVPQLCDALQYAHDRGIVHRDIKPENVLISQDGHLKIADFGLAKLTGASNNLTLTQTKQVMGTLNYMAPEQMERPTEVDHRADIYSLGVVIYELLTGELPLGRFSPPSQKVQVDVRLDEVVMRALEKEPNMRFQQVSEFKTGIQTASGAGVMPLFGGTPKDQQFAGKIAKFMWLTAGITCCLAGALFIVLSGGLDQGMLDDNIARLIGFSLLFFGGLVFAIGGIYSAVFHPKTEVKKPQPKLKARASEPTKMPLSILFIRCLAMFFMFSCGIFFISGSGSINMLDEDLSRFLGIASAITGAFLFAVSGMVAKAKGYSEDDD